MHLVPFKNVCQMCASFRILANYRKFIENRKTPVNLDLIGLRVFYKLVKNFKKLLKNASGGGRTHTPSTGTGFWVQRVCQFRHRGIYLN